MCGGVENADAGNALHYDAVRFFVAEAVKHREDFALSDANAAQYFERSDAYDMALDLTGGRRGLSSRCGGEGS